MSKLREQKDCNRNQDKDVHLASLVIQIVIHNLHNPPVAALMNPLLHYTQVTTHYAHNLTPRSRAQSVGVGRKYLSNRPRSA